MAFSHSGESLAIAYRKSRRLRNEHDIYVFKIDQKELFDSENLDTEKLLTETPYDVTALCYSQHDNFLLCGTGSGAIFVLECKPVDRNPKTNESLVHNWTYVMYLQSSGHKNEIKKISFSAKFRYMATLDVKGVLTIWNGGSWTPILNFEAEPSRHYVHLEWHPFVEEELILGKRFYPALYLLNVAQKSAVACFMSWKEELELTSIAFNPITAQLAVCFYNRGNYFFYIVSTQVHSYLKVLMFPRCTYIEECVNRVSLLASMSQVINTFDFDYIEGGLKLFWNRTGTMLGAGAECFCFAFWSFHKSRDFHHQMVKCSTSKNPEIFPLNFMKMSSLR